MKMIFTLIAGIGFLQINPILKKENNPNKDFHPQFQIAIDSSKIGQSFLAFEALNILTNKKEELPRTTKKIQFYNFWFSSCGPCIAEMPMFDHLGKKYQKEVEFNAVNFEKPNEIIEFLKGNDFNFQQYHLGRKEIHNLSVTLGYPTTIIVKDEKIIYCSHGGPTMDDDDLDEKMKEIQFNLELKIEDGLSNKH